MIAAAFDGISCMLYPEGADSINSQAMVAVEVAFLQAGGRCKVKAVF